MTKTDMIKLKQDAEYAKLDAARTELKDKA